MDDTDSPGGFQSSTAAEIVDAGVTKDDTDSAGGFWRTVAACSGSGSRDRR